MNTSDVLFDSTGHAAFLTFNRPAARNAMTWAMYDALAEACDRVDANENTRVLVLRGAGGAFGAGTDISQFADFASGADGLAYERRLETCLDRLERVGVPTIAQVDGVATGAGFAIALACDLRVATPAARFGVPIARTLGNGLSTANCARLIDHVGPGFAKDLLITGRLLEAQEALALGMVTRVVEADRIDDAVRDLIATIAANAPLTIRAAKDAFRRLARHRRLPASEVAEADGAIGACYASADFREGVSAFLARRRPKFSGR